jgi:Xaa-Pro aminopeptidase
MARTQASKSRSSSTRVPWPDHLVERVRVLQKRLSGRAARGADALVVTNPRDIRYLSGFVGDDSWALVPLRLDPRDERRRKLWLLSDFRFEEQIDRDAPHTTPLMRKKGLVEELRKLMKRSRIGKVAVQPGHVTVALRRKLAAELGARSVVEVEDGLLEQRSVKDADEVRAISRALAIQQQAFRETLELIEPGRTEEELAAFLEYRMRSLGADGPSFPTIVAVDANAALPHAIPGSTPLTQGSIVLIDWGARWGGYCSDLTRVVAVGRMPAKMREVYRVVLEAQQAAIDAIAPGVAMKQVDAAARRVITKAGYGKAFGHGTGHGLGLDIHELPTLGKRTEGELEVGQVVTVEPGIYLPGVGGVRIEDDVVVTERGGRVLSDLPKSLESAII